MLRPAALLALLALSACERPAAVDNPGGRNNAGLATPPASSPAPSAANGAVSPPAPGLVWRTLGTWSGRGTRQTESFDVTTGALRVTWEARNASAEAPFEVVLHSAISGRELQTVVRTRNPGGATEYVQDEPRVSYLVVHATDVDWRVTIEEGAAAPPRLGS